MKSFGLGIFLVLAFWCVVALGFKVMHWPFAGILLVVSFSSVAMLAFFQAIVGKYQEGRSVKFKLISKGVLIGFSLYTIGVLFYIQRWPSSTILMMIGGVELLSMAAFLYTLGLKNEGDKIPTNILLCGLLAVMIISLGIGVRKGGGDQYGELTKEWVSLRNNIRNCKAMHLEMALMEREVRIQDTTMVDSIAADSIEIASDELLRKAAARIAGMHDALIEHCQFEPRRFDSLSLEYMGSELLNRDICSYFMIGDDPSNPQGEGKELHFLLAELDRQLQALGQLPVFGAGTLEAVGPSGSWEVEKFYDKPLVEVLTELKRLELKLCEKK